MNLVRWLRGRRAEKQQEREAIAQASRELRRAGDEPTREQLDAAADRAVSQFPPG
jgi:hypothetical protein